MMARRSMGMDANTTTERALRLRPLMCPDPNQSRRKREIWSL